jgi:hypothetical protein
MVMSELKNVLTRYVRARTPTTAPPFDAIGLLARRRAHRRVAASSITAVAIVAVAIGGVSLARKESPGAPQANAPVATPTTTASQPVPNSKQPATTSPRTGALPNGPNASCVEPYNLRNLRNRGVSFDGTVVKTSPVQSDRAGAGGVSGYLMVSFQVHQWFRGGSGTSTSVDMFGPTMSSAQHVSYGVGTRLLVSGEPEVTGGSLPGPIGWGCGFTRYYDPATAASWRQGLGR